MYSTLVLNHNFKKILAQSLETFPAGKMRYMVQKIERKGEKMSMLTFANVKLLGTKQSLQAY
jgi:hypothetical protein